MMNAHECLFDAMSILARYITEHDDDRFEPESSIARQRFDAVQLALEHAGHAYESIRSSATHYGPIG